MTSSSTPAPDIDDAPPSSDLVPSWWPLARTGITVRSLERDHCLQLLATETTGRLFVLQQLAHPLPVHYRVSDEGLLVDAPREVADCSGDGSQLVMLCVDRLDSDAVHGWSLVVVGTLLPVDEVERADARPHSTALNLRSLTGKSFTASHVRHLELLPGS